MTELKIIFGLFYRFLDSSCFIVRHHALFLTALHPSNFLYASTIKPRHGTPMKIARYNELPSASAPTRANHLPRGLLPIRGNHVARIRKIWDSSGDRLRSSCSKNNTKQAQSVNANTGGTKNQLSVSSDQSSVISYRFTVTGYRLLIDD